MAAFQSEKGPWHAVIIDDHTVHIQSDDFTHDVSLDVIGDFADVFDRHAYGCAIAEILNANMPLKPVT